jgi:alpha-mannosidase
MTEQELCRQLGIPADAETVVILSQTSHLDWDWLTTFPELCSNASSPYFDGTGGRPAFEIFDAAVERITANVTANPPYYYSVAEVAFLQAYGEHDPQNIEKLKRCKEHLHLCGGGMTSPDNLLPHGETFIRNFLLAERWNAAHLRLPVQNLWIPDDFGHDSQLPVAVAAMGLVGAGFARVPGALWENKCPGSPTDHSPSLWSQLTDHSADFVWRANDGSELLAHYMTGGYSQGDKVGLDPTTNIAAYCTANLGSATTRYLFVPVGSDFQPPVGSFPDGKNLLELVNAWNQGAASDGETGARRPWAVAATFDHYLQLVSYHRARLTRRSFDGVPYWLGIFASRPANKILHYSASRTLLAAEVLGLVADGAGRRERTGRFVTPNPARQARQREAWAALVPSTHHHYITGTSGTSTHDVAIDVNSIEQLPRLQLAASMAGALCTAAVEEIARGVDVPARTNAFPVVVCNPLGFPRRGIAALPGGASFTAASTVPTGDEPAGAVQQADDGSLLFVASAPSLGYSTTFINTLPTTLPAPAVTLRPAGPGAYELSNGLLTVLVDATRGGITAFNDLRGANPSAGVLTGIGNELVFYTDTGNIYRYGNEPMPAWAIDPEGGIRLVKLPQRLAWTAEGVESGPHARRCGCRRRRCSPARRTATPAPTPWWWANPSCG